MRVVFSKPQNCPGFNDGDFRDGGSAFQHMGPETAKAREPNVTDAQQIHKTQSIGLYWTYKSK